MLARKSVFPTLSAILLTLGVFGCTSKAVETSRKLPSNEATSQKAIVQHIKPKKPTTTTLDPVFEELAADPLLEPNGMSFKKSNDLPLMSKQEAISKAISNSLGYGQPTNVKAVYALYNCTSPLRPRSLGYSRDYILKDLPVWLVRFEGLKINSRGPNPQPPPHTQLNVIIADETGEVLEAFTFR